MAGIRSVLGIGFGSGIVQSYFDVGFDFDFETDPADFGSGFGAVVGSEDKVDMVLVAGNFGTVRFQC